MTVHSYGDRWTLGVPATVTNQIEGGLTVRGAPNASFRYVVHQG